MEGRVWRRMWGVIVLSLLSGTSRSWNNVALIFIDVGIEQCFAFLSRNRFGMISYMCICWISVTNPATLFTQLLTTSDARN